LAFRRRNILKLQADEWRLKSRVSWVEAGDRTWGLHWGRNTIPCEFILGDI